MHLVRAFFAAMLLFALPAAAQQPAPPRKLTVAYLKSLSFSPLFLAVEKKYLAEEGIELDLKIVGAVSEVIAFLGRGQIDAAVGNSGVPLLNAVSRGIEIRLAGGLGGAPADAATLSANPILVRKALFDAGTVKTAADLKGRKLAVNARGGIVEYQTAQGLKQGGLTIGDVEIVMLRSFPDMLAALSNGAIDASLLPEPLAASARSSGIATTLIANPAPGAMITSLMLGQTLLPEHERPVVEKLLRALRRAANELQSPAAIMTPERMAIWSRWVDVPVEVIAQTAPYAFPRDLAIDVADLMRQQAFLVETGQIPAAVPADRIIDARYAIVK